MKEILISKFCKELDLEIVCDGGHDAIHLSNSSINRPGLQLYGYYDHFDSDRVQIVGMVENSYLNSLKAEEKLEKLGKFFTYHFPCLVIAWDLDIEDDLLDLANKYHRVVLKSKKETTKVINQVINYLDVELAPVISVHGVLVEVFGVGVLITGSSGVGKSETALELVKRGHRLITDDMVEIKRIGDRLHGVAPKFLKQYMEIRGIGIIDVRTLYGIGAVKESMELDMNVHLEHWDSEKYYDRLGLDEEYHRILDVDIPRVVIPVTSGRNLAIIIEAGARNNRLKYMGINSAQEFCDRISKSNENMDGSDRG
ncbi:HPr(Ser) kinase/phosphatase [Alkalibacter rhizosphaerae]|uniref:HPr kinase/phosphorylase n=1 Tax=Alkalibacter rhizosphaerae TaxID=2815577 RepID=A0A975AH60_9FIRM|nr:HPr(Ser) kinase/phosphatase [Alkalibacter rhizosphaerae]QSX08269.1 HPr(Ser) kinase/phosphatase [Alkalibacter rhizosphaerae]